MIQKSSGGSSKKPPAGSANDRESGTRNIPAPKPKPKPKPKPTVPKTTPKTDTNNNPNAGSSRTTTTPPSTPTPAPIPPGYSVSVVKNPTRDTLNIASLVPQTSAETISKLLFEQFSAVELSIIESNRTISGIEQHYSIISNLSEIREKYNATKSLTNIVRGAIFNKYTIDLQSKIPGNDYIVSNGLDEEYSYIDENDVVITREKGFLYFDSNGDLVIELINMYPGEQVQVQIDRNGTIYKVEI